MLHFLPNGRKRQNALCALAALLALVPLICAQVAQAQTDPAAPGPYVASARMIYDLGDQAYLPTDFNFPAPPASIGPKRVEIRAAVRIPTLPPNPPPGLSTGPYPLIILLHGRHGTCVGATLIGIPPNQVPVSLLQFKWPCAPAEVRIDSYLGYDYLAQRLATQGYIVVSISANGINAYDNFLFPTPANPNGDAGSRARAEVIRQHLMLLDRINDMGAAAFTGNANTPANRAVGDALKGKIDRTRVGLMGHSRGGEGVAAFGLLPEYTRFTIKAVLLIAPTYFRFIQITRIPLGVVLPYCDGDVGLAGMHYYDHVRYLLAGDPAPKHTFLVMGANHNYYNTVWSPSTGPSASGAIDDWCETAAFSQDPQPPVPYETIRLDRANDPACGCPPMGMPPNPNRLTEAQQQANGLGIVTAFFRRYVGNETGDNNAFVQLLKGDMLFPATAMGDKMFVSYHPPDTPTTRRLVNAYPLNPNAAMRETPNDRNELNGVIDQKLLDPYMLCGFLSGCLPLPENALRDAHTPFPDGRNLLKIAWQSRSAIYYTELPVAAENVSGFRVFQFRVSVDFSDDRNRPGRNQDFTITFADSMGRAASTTVSAIPLAGRVLFYPPGDRNGMMPDPTSGINLWSVPHMAANTVRIPLTAFPGVDLRKLRRIYFRFNIPQTFLGTPKGVLFFTDLMFAD